MALNFSAEPVPIELDADGVARVGGTRVTLDTVVNVFNNGATAEEIAQQYPALKLVDVYAVITYYLRSQSEVDAYIAQRQIRAAQVRQENEARFNPVGIRDRLLDEKGVRRFVNIYVGDEDIRFLDGLDTQLKSNDEISIVPAIAGGA